MMGARGPKPLPANVHALRGNPSKLPLHRFSDSVQPDIEIPGYPKHLLPEARKEWRRIAPLLEGLGLIAKIDRTALALYCQEYAWWVWHDEGLQRDIKICAEKLLAFEAAEQGRLSEAEKIGQTYVAREWAGGDGYSIPTRNGSLMYNPHWVERNKAGEKLDKYLASFGMSPSSRGRVTPSSRTAYLPGMEPKGDFDKL